MLLALAASFETAWIVALVVGVVVLAVVVVLLHWLLRIVERIDRNVRQVWETATRLASNTATTWQLNETAVALDELRTEAMRHDAFLERATGGRP